MSPFVQAILPILIISGLVAAACFIIAWLDIALHRKCSSLPSHQEMRRHMLCGFYCNPEDPRPVVHRPVGRGYTINLRREHLVVTLLVMAVLAMFAAALMYVVPAQ
jgi:uncharacterized membrane protein